jgi:hypothetical protein
MTETQLSSSFDAVGDQEESSCLTRKIRGTDYRISIYWQCSRCGTIVGIVTNDTSKIYYSRSMIIFHEGDGKLIPEKICSRCLKGEGSVFH